MTGFIIDAVIVLVVLLCAFHGFRAGVVRGVAGFLALVLSLIIASAVSNAFAGEFTGVVRPFVGGLVDAQMQKILAPDNGEDTETETETETEEPEKPEAADLAEYDETTTYGMAMLALRRLGFFKPVADTITKTIEQETSKVGFALAETITNKLCLMFAKIAVFAITFILLAIIFAILGNVINFVFSLPGLKLADQIAGTALGLLRGLLIVFVAATILRYFGVIAANTIEKTAILETLVSSNPIAGILKM